MADPYLPDELSATATVKRFGVHVIDPYTFLDHKTTFGATGGGLWAAPTWTGEHKRRLQAYKIYEDYYRNASREWLGGEATPDDKAKRREYGDAFVFVEQFLNSLMGDDQSVVVPAAVGKTIASGPENTFLKTMTQWAEDDLLDMKVEEAERSSLKLGDGVYVLGEDSDGMPTVEVWDPGFYFPVLDPTLPSSQYPTKVHIAWEFERKTATETRRYVRRKTYELMDLVRGDDVETPADIKYPWRKDTSPRSCVYSEAEWEIGDIKTKDSSGYDDLDWERATSIITEPTPMGIDFIPIVHIPSLTPSLQEHFGISVLGSVIQILDDLQGTDTDTQASAATTGSPPLILSGAGLATNEYGQVTTYGPGQVFQVGDGSGTMIDTSKSLDALIKLDDKLLERLSVNGRIPESMLGRVKPSEVPSGIALAISFGPHTGVIKRMRKVRRRKYAILFKFAARIMQKNNLVNEIFHVEYHFGSFLPSDRSETLQLVTQGLTSKPPAISQSTGLRMLIEAGFPIEDAVAELKLIQQEDFESANQLLDATGDPSIVARRLGVEVTTTPPQLPPTGA
jgi:hypothetical protein